MTFMRGASSRLSCYDSREILAKVDSAELRRLSDRFLLGDYLFFHPPRCPGAPPVERGEGPNSGPDWRELVGWMIRLSPPNGFCGSAPSGRKGRELRAVHFVEMGFVDFGGAGTGTARGSPLTPTLSP